MYYYRKPMTLTAPIKVQQKLWHDDYLTGSKSSEQTTALNLLFSV